MIRIAMLGFWHLHGKDYAEAAEENPDTNIVAVWDSDEERGRGQADRFGAEFVGDLDQILARSDVDAVVVTSETNRHREIIIAAARAGKHIFTEKVIAATLEDAEAILAEVEASGVSFMVSMWRSDEAYAPTIKNLIDSGAVGRVTQVRVRDGHPFALPFGDSPGGILPEHFYDPATAQGGALIDLCHPVYLICSFLGLPESVSATFGYATGRAVEDNAVVSFRYPGGAIGIAETGYVSAVTPFLIEVHGTEGSILFSLEGIGEMAARWRMPADYEGVSPSALAPDGILKLRSTSPGSESRTWERVELPTAAQPKAFAKWIANIQSGTTDPVNAELGRQLSAVIEAAYRSADTESSVSLSSLSFTDQEI